MSQRIKIGDEWYVSVKTARSDERPQVVKYDETFALFDHFGDVHPWGSGEQGLYHQDTRFLSKMQFTLDGVQPMFLGSAVKEGNNLLIAELMNPDMEHGGQELKKGEVHIFRAKLLWQESCYEHIRLRNYGGEAAQLALQLRFDADFVDVFEVRGNKRDKRGEKLPVRRDAQGLQFAYRGLDDKLRRTHIQLRPAPHEWEEQHDAHYEVTLPPGGEWHLYCTVSCEVEGERRRPVLEYDEAYRHNAQELDRHAAGKCRVQTSSALMNRWIDRSISDVAMLTTELDTGPFPYAGVPWYATTFGRDALLTAREMVWLDPSLARGVLRFLAAKQATHEDKERDAEPGKILHEARKDEMANTGEVPFGRYYGTVDATPLFVGLAGAYYRRTGDLDLIRSLWPNILAALEWIDRWGDADNDGFVEYSRHSAHGLAQQGWKDSQDSVFHADGSMAEGPIALCEVQGYVYDAKLFAADMAQDLGDAKLAARLREQAAQLRQQFAEQFWLEDLGCYALALDGRKRPCRVLTSNAGHCLWGGIAAPEHAARVARRLLEPDFFSGWGIRTVAEGQARYNPMSYHNGSIWPHDNALIAAGMARYGHTDAALKVLAGMYDSTLHFHQHRLPELFCGFERRECEGPTLYPVACSPQAWAAAAVFGIVQGCLGLDIDGRRATASLRAPRLPEFIEQLELRDLQVGQGRLDLRLTRYENNVGVEVLRKEGEVAVRIDV